MSFFTKKRGIKISLFNKVFFSIMVLFIIGSLINLVISIKQQNKVIEENLIENVKRHAWIASISVRSGYMMEHWPFEILKKLRECEEIVYWRVITQNGEIVLADDTKMWGKKISDPALRTEKMLVKDEIFPETGEKIKVIVNPIGITENGDLTFWLGFSLESVAKERGKIIFNNIVMTAIGIIFVSLISLYLARSITIPVKHLVKGTKAVARGDLSHKIPVETRDELGLLASLFNKMTQDLQKITVSKDYVDNIVRSMTDTLIVVSPAGKINTVNQATLDLLGYEEEELIGREISFLFEEELPLRKARLEELIKKGLLTNYELNYKTKNGRMLPVLFSGAVMKDRDSSIISIVCVAKDITDRKQAEEEKEKMQVQLLQARKMEAIGMLSGGIAHDFNNLLTVIQGNAELAMRKIDEENPLWNNLKRICSTTERAANLTGQLLLFSRKQLMKPALFSINKTVGDLLEMLSRLIGEDIIVKTDLTSDLWTIRADKASIEQMIINLVVNARDAMPKGGEIIIKTENLILEEEYCNRVPYSRPGKFIRFSVEDTGVGIDEEVIQHIFEPFFSTKEIGKGTGFGLSVVYGIAKRHEGWINAYSELGQGSIFKIYLPAVFEKLEMEDEIKEEIPISELHGHSERILLVEDEDGVREFAVSTLHENGYVVFEAANVKEALDIFEKEKGNFQMVFSDVVLPDQSGLELVNQLLSSKSDLPVLLSSGYMDEKSQWSVIRERGFKFLQKPYSLADLLQAVKEVLEESLRSRAEDTVHKTK